MDFLNRTNTGAILPEFHELFRTVLNPIRHRVPVDFLRDWQVSLKNRESIDGKVSMLYEASRGYLSSHEYSSLSVQDKCWADAVVYITLHSLCGIEIVWMDGLPEVSLDSNIIPEQLVLDKLTILYNTWKAGSGTYPCAQPYAFCIVTEAALKINGFRIPPATYDAIFNYLNQEEYFDIQDYYNWGSKGVGRSINGLTIFVKDYAESDSPLGLSEDDNYDLNHLKKIDLGKVNIKEKRSREIPLTILVAGLTGSGKTFLIKELYYGNLKSFYLPSPFINLSVVQIPGSAQGEIDSYTKPGKPAPNVADCFELESTFKIGNDSSYRLSLIDTKGGLLTEPPRPYFATMNTEDLPSFEKNLGNADLLLLVIDPETFFEKNQTTFYSQVIGGITARLNILFSKSQHAMIGIVFSKFDEYGIMITGNRRLIHNIQQAEALINYQKQEGGHEAWDELMHNIVSNGSPVGNDSMTETLKELLKRIKGLINNIVVGHKHLAFNVYLTSVQLIENNSTTTTFNRGGLPMIFNDFERYMNWLINADLPTQKINAKHIPKIGIELCWDNPNQQSGSFIISRTDDGKSYEKIGDFNQTGTSGESKYYDAKVKNGKRYIYKISRNESSKEAKEVNVLTVPDPVHDIVVELIPLNDDNKIPGIKITWEAPLSDYEMQYKLRRKENNKSKAIESQWRELMVKHRGTTYNDYSVLTPGSSYSYEIIASAVGDSITESQPAASETIVFPRKEINWLFIVFVVVVIAIIIYLITQL